MKYVTYKGSLYSKVTERIKALKTLNRPYSITTTEEQLQIDNFFYWKVKVLLQMLDTNEVYTGMAMRRLEADHPFGRYPLEWAETVATARAIGKMGIGIDYSYACLEELGDLDSTQVTDRDGGDAPKVELDKGEAGVGVAVDAPVIEKEAFTKEDMKESLGIVDAPQPVEEIIPDTPVEPEVPEAPPITKAEKLAAKLAAKKDISVKPPKKGKPIEIPVEPAKAPDKVDRMLDAIEKAEPHVVDPIFGDDTDEVVAEIPDITEEPLDIPGANDSPDITDEQAEDEYGQAEDEYGQDVVIDLD